MTISPALSPSIRAGKVIDWPETGIKIKGRRSTPGRYFQVAEPGLGWGGTDVEDPLTILGDWNARSGCAARADPADGVHHRRAVRLLHS